MNAYHSNGLGIGRRLKILRPIADAGATMKSAPHMSLGISHPLNSRRS